VSWKEPHGSLGKSCIKHLKWRDKINLDDSMGLGAY
jgi:hypothetical protein